MGHGAVVAASLWVVAVVAVVGCGDTTGPNTAPKDAMGPVDAAPDTVAADTAPGDAPDTTTPSPCEGFACPEVPDRCSVDHTEALSFAPGVCDDSTGQPVCAPVPTAEACGAAGLCMSGACREIGTFCDFPLPDHASLLTVMVPGGLSSVIDPATGEPDDQCCTDFDGDGRIDNGAGAVIASLEPFLGPAADVTMGAVARATPIFGLYGVDDLADDPDVTLVVTEGELYDAPSETISLAAHGFTPGTVHPLGIFSGAIAGGVFSSESGYYDLVLGTKDISFPIRVDQARVAFAVTPGAGPSTGFALGGPPGRARGWFSGVTAVDGWLAGLNVSARALCTCSEFDDPDEPVIDPATRRCKTVYAPPGCEEAESLCRLLTTSAEVCDIVVAMLAPDLDLDGNGVLDHGSMGAWLEGAPVVVRGREDCN